MVFFLWLEFFLCLVSGDVTISNTKNLVDSGGNWLLTGESSMLPYNGNYYLYLNDWGDCTDDTCQSPCVYGVNHTIGLYVTKDFQTWDYKGVVLPLSARQNGTVFRPQVVYNPFSKQFLMWYENRYPCTDRSCTHYAIAIADTPEGPFKTSIESVDFSCPKGGDFSLFVDTEDNNTAYVIVTATDFCIAQLDSTYTKTTGATGSIVPPSSAEGPNLFRRGNLYYALYGKGCCACTGGSNIWVSSSPKPLGPYTFQGDVGTLPNGTYATRAQQSAIFPVPAMNGTIQYLWLGNQWGTAPDRVYDHDLLYWYSLQFLSNNSIAQVQWVQEIEISLV